VLHTILIPILAGWWPVLVSYWNLVVANAVDEKIEE
jgi:hypothetical protein